jgi:hypothetical protein
MGAAREHGIIDAINATGIRAVAESAYGVAGPAIRISTPGSGGPTLPGTRGPS